MPKLLELLQQIASLECDRHLKLSYAHHAVSGYVDEHPNESVADIVVAIYFRETRELPRKDRDSVSRRDRAVLELFGGRIDE